MNGFVFSNVIPVPRINRIGMTSMTGERSYRNQRGKSRKYIFSAADHGGDPLLSLIELAQALPNLLPAAKTAAMLLQTANIGGVSPGRSYA